MIRWKFLYADYDASILAPHLGEAFLSDHGDVICTRNRLILVKLYFTAALRITDVDVNRNIAPGRTSAIDFAHTKEGLRPSI